MFDLRLGNCIEVMKSMPDNSVDSIVTDPPYELGFMGKSWDSSGVAFNVEVWQEALRVLKPGGHLLAFSGSRTYHRMAVAIEDAGFEIRDQIMWIYGSGFPKSHDVSKGIDKQAGAERKRELKWVAIASGSGNYGGGAKGGAMAEVQTNKAITPEAQQWQGWGTALKPAHEPIVLARKPLIGTVAANVLEWGVGGLNIDGTRVESNESWVGQNLINASPLVGYEGGDGLNKQTSSSHPNGRWPANVIHDGSDEVVELFPDRIGMATQRSGKNIKVYGGNSLLPSKTEFSEIRVGFNDSGSAARFFYCAKTSKRDRNEGLDGFEKRQQDESRKEGNVGGDNPRNRGLNKVANHHPTVKPTDLMRYLCRMVTPPNGTVLDPFNGSGSTGKACMYEKFNYIGIDIDAEYLKISRARIEFALQDQTETLFDA